MIDPKEMMRTLSVEALCQTADGYYQAITDPTQLLAKPFGSLLEAPEILQNMGTLLSGLKLGKTMTVLEFAAGTCWFSKYLRELQCRTISCDASQLALDLGKKLFSDHPNIGPTVADPEFLHFNGRTIDLPSESVDRIVCHDGFHHIPNQEEVIAELARVLKTGGIAAFSEPGRHHSRSHQSQLEMKNYKVLENDIILEDIFALSKKHGFTDIKVRMQGDLDVNLREYLSMIKGRPGFGLLGKMVRNIRTLVTNKTLFFLYKGEFVSDSRSHYGLDHGIVSSQRSVQAKCDEEFRLPITITNTGTARWLARNLKDIGVVNVGTHLYDDALNLISLGYSRHAFQGGAEPGQMVSMEINLKVNRPGNFVLAIDMVSELVCWFESVGSKPLMIPLQIT